MESSSRSKNLRIQDGYWDTIADRVSSMNQRICWDPWNTLGWGKAPGRAETLALRTPSSWKAFPCHNLLEEQLALPAKPHPIDPWSCCFSSTRSSATPGLHSTGLHHLCRAPAPQPCHAHDPHARIISAGPMPLKPTRDTNHRPAQSLLGPHTSDLPSLQSIGLHNLHQAPPPQAQKISAGPLPLSTTGPAIHRPARYPQWQASACRQCGTIYLPPTTGGLQTCLGDKDRQD
jgi:hypothetical protein